jgi:hypothetical protein
MQPSDPATAPAHALGATAAVAFDLLAAGSALTDVNIALLAAQHMYWVPLQQWHFWPAVATYGAFFQASDAAQGAWQLDLSTAQPD